MTPNILDGELNCPNYMVVRKDRFRGKGGGLLLYLRESLPFARLISLETNKIENIWIEIVFPSSKPILLGLYYRPPSQNMFFEEFEANMSKAAELRREMIIIGDFNEDSLNKSIKKTKLHCTVDTFHVRQIISESAIVAATSSTLIDHLYISAPELVQSSGVCKVSLSEHYLIFMVRRHKKCGDHKNGHTVLESRSYSNFNAEFTHGCALSKLGFSLLYS